MPPVVDTQQTPYDLTVNSNTYLYVQEVTVNDAGDQAAYINLLSFSNETSTITDDPSGAVSSTVGTTGYVNNKEALPGESVGIPAGDPLANFLDDRYGAGHWLANYYSKLGTEPIITINSDAGSIIPEDQTFFLMTNSPTPISANVSTFNPTTLSFSNFFYCFEKNTLISTPMGAVLVSKLNIGDAVLTSDNDIVKVKWIGRQTINRIFAKLENAMPIKISAGALGDSLPTTDLFVSPGHGMLVDGVLVHALALVNGSTITQVQRWSGDVEYFHIETENHELILANGAPAETFIDNVSRTEFDNWTEYDALYPNVAPMVELDLPRVKFARQLPKAISDRLNAVAELISPQEVAA